MHELLQVMSFFATAEHEKERLQYFASPEGRDDLYQYNQKERRTVLEVRIWSLFDDIYANWIWIFTFAFFILQRIHKSTVI